MKTAITAAIALLIVLSFWCGVRHGRQNIIHTQSELLQAQKELKASPSMEIARKSQIQWLRQRNYAFEEVVLLYQEEINLDKNPKKQYIDCAMKNNNQNKEAPFQ